MTHKYAGYLFCYFTGKEENLEDEQVYFSVSQDGLHWRDLNNQKPVLSSSIGTRGIRDPFIIRVEKEHKYIILATDLHIASGTDWDQAAYFGSTQIICWESEDLVNWSLPYTFETGMNEAGCVWAPEAIYDNEKQEYMVYWSSLTNRGEHGKYKIYCCYTKDFHEFSTPQLYMEKDRDIIDTTFAWDGKEYFRFSKDESAKELMDVGYTSVEAPVLESMEGVEGPAIFQFNGEKKWCLLLDCFKEQKGYIPLITENLESGVFKALHETEYDFGKLKKRHGSVIKLTKEELSRMEEYYESETKCTFVSRPHI